MGGVNDLDPGWVEGLDRRVSLALFEPFRRRRIRAFVVLTRHALDQAVVDSILNDALIGDRDVSHEKATD